MATRRGYSSPCPAICLQHGEFAKEKEKNLASFGGLILELSDTYIFVAK
jgi:hypothetical protein